jgi:isocitrate lyase
MDDLYWEEEKQPTFEDFKKIVDAINEMWPSGSPLQEIRHEHR